MTPSSPMRVFGCLLAVGGRGTGGAWTRSRGRWNVRWVMSCRSKPLCKASACSAQLPFKKSAAKPLRPPTFPAVARTEAPAGRQTPLNERHRSNRLFPMSAFVCWGIYWAPVWRPVLAALFGGDLRPNEATFKAGPGTYWRRDVVGRLADPEVD